MEAAKSSESSISGSLEIRLLGSFRVFLDGSPVEGRRWSRRKAQSLVQLLALQPHHQLHREQIMEMLWPDLDVEAAANSLHKALHAARRVLEPDLEPGAYSRFIISQGSQILLRAPRELRVDVDEFEQQARDAIKGAEIPICEAAAALYDGDLLVEELYEDWTSARREAVRALYFDLLAKHASLCESQGRYDRGIESLKRLIASEPSNEEAHRQLMRLYAVTGNRHQALKQYQLCQDALRKELDVGPAKATVELYEQITSGGIEPLVPAQFADKPGAPANERRAEA